MVSVKVMKNESMLFVRRRIVYIEKQTNNKKDVVQKKKRLSIKQEFLII